MPATPPEFTINDEETIDQNLQRFGALLKQLDPELGAVLASKLRDLADSDPADISSLWQALFNSLVPPASGEEVGNREEDEEEASA